MHESIKSFAANQHSKNIYSQLRAQQLKRKSKAAALRAPACNCGKKHIFLASNNVFEQEIFRAIFKLYPCHFYSVYHKNELLRLLNKQRTFEVAIFTEDFNAITIKKIICDFRILNPKKDLKILYLGEDSSEENSQQLKFPLSLEMLENICGFTENTCPPHVAEA